MLLGKALTSESLLQTAGQHTGMAAPSPGAARVGREKLEAAVDRIAISPRNLIAIEYFRRMGDVYDLLTMFHVSRSIPGRDAKWSPSGNLLATRALNGIYIWDPMRDSLVLEINRGRPVSTMEWSPAGDVLASAHPEGSIRLWCPDTGTLKRDLGGYDDAPISDLAWSPSGDTLAAISEDKRAIWLWDPESGALKENILGCGPSTRIVWSPSGARLASASEAAIKVWDPRTGVEMSEMTEFLDEYDDDEFDVLFSSRDTLLSVSGTTIRLWDARSGGLRAVHGPVMEDEYYQHEMQYVAISPSGNLVATAGPGDVYLWDTTSGATKSLLPETEDCDVIWGLAWAPSGDMLVAFTRDYIMFVWIINT